MALYVYQVIEADGSEGEVFEVLQSMSDTPLAVHPDNGKPVRRLLSAPNTITRFAAGNLSPSRLGSLGFTQYKKAGDGRYEKTAGSGPDLIKG
jgi:hypothetical protein